MKTITPKGYVCGFASTSPTIDGRLDEAVWKAAPWTDDFVDIEGDRKPKPRFRTRAKMVWDQEYFYLAAELDEPHVWATLTKHDAVIFHDNDFEVFIDPNGDNHEYYELELNALNTTWDLFLPRPYKDGGKADNSWEIPGLKSAVHVKGTLNDPTDQDTGWSVEIAIPWKVLGKQARRAAPPNHGDQWRVNFSRVEWRHEVVNGKYRKVPDTREDNWVWSPQGIIDMHRPERWGFVQFSKEVPGKTAFTPDGHSQNRDLLMEVYHRQKSFHKQHGKWAGSLKELDFAPGEEVAKRLELRRTDDGFRATLEVPRAGNSPQQHWHVRQDSRLWMSVAGKDGEKELDRANDHQGQTKGNIDIEASRAAVGALKTYLAVEESKRKSLADEPFASVPLTRDDANRAAELLRQDHAARIRQSRAAEMEKRELVAGNLKMPFYSKTYGAKPDGGRSMYISLHGGGGTTKQVNDGQWENQKRLYTLEEGVYVAPRAPTNMWNLWHEGHIDGLFDRLIENMIVLEGVNPNRVYVMGYSAGGDGVFQLAPRMADRWAGAAMMAGHPNETSPLGLRNLAFTMHVGGRDSAYSRNKVARDWQQKLAELQKADPAGYVHWVKIYEDKGHWLDREDAAAIPWLAKHTRNPVPSRIIWKQDDVVHHRFYWLAVEPGQAKARAEVLAERDGQDVRIQSSDVKRVLIRLNDQMLDLDKPVRVTMNGKLAFEGDARRTAAVLAKSLAERGDPLGIFAAEVGIELPLSPP